MAAVTLRDGQMLDSADVFKHVENFLPAYARPRFIRIQVHFPLSFKCFSNICRSCDSHPESTPPLTQCQLIG